MALLAAPEAEVTPLGGHRWTTSTGATPGSGGRVAEGRRVTWMAGATAVAAADLGRDGGRAARAAGLGLALVLPHDIHPLGPLEVGQDGGLQAAPLGQHPVLSDAREHVEGNNVLHGHDGDGGLLAEGLQEVHEGVHRLACLLGHGKEVQVAVEQWDLVEVDFIKVKQGVPGPRGQYGAGLGIERVAVEAGHDPGVKAAEEDVVLVQGDGPSGTAGLAEVGGEGGLDDLDLNGRGGERERREFEAGLHLGATAATTETGARGSRSGGGVEGILRHGDGPESFGGDGDECLVHLILASDKAGNLGGVSSGLSGPKKEGCGLGSGLLDRLEGLLDLADGSSGGVAAEGSGEAVDDTGMADSSTLAMMRLISEHGGEVAEEVREERPEDGEDGEGDGTQGEDPSEALMVEDGGGGAKRNSTGHKTGVHKAHEAHEAREAHMGHGRVAETTLVHKVTAPCCISKAPGM